MTLTEATSRRRSDAQVDLQKIAIGSLIRIVFEEQDCYLTVHLEERPRKASFRTLDAARATVIESRFPYTAQQILNVERCPMFTAGQCIGLVAACRRIEGKSLRASFTDAMPTWLIPQRHLILSDPGRGGEFWVYPWKVTQLHIASP